MQEEHKDFYLKNGRLDLSALDGECNEQSEDEKYVPLQAERRIYKDQSIDGILKEMGDLFAND